MLLTCDRIHKPLIWGNTLPSLDLLIVGQGLIGSLLAHAAADAGLEFTVIDDGHEDAASLAAAGLMTPFTGRRFSAPQNLETLLDIARRRYATLSERLNAPLYRPQPMIRVFTLDEEHRRHARQRQTAAGARLLGPIQPAGHGPAGMPDPMGSCRIEGGGQVDVATLLQQTRAWLMASGRLQQARLQPAELTLLAEGCQWQEHSARLCVLCTGHQARHWDAFRGLPWRLSRGQALILRRETTMPLEVVHAGRTLAPLDEGRAWFGATYEHDLDKRGPDPGARETLLDDYQRLFPEAPAPKVLDQIGGIRAGSRHGPPFAGLTSNDPALGLLDGFGSRGTLLGPWHVDRFVERFTNNTLATLKP